MTIRRDLEDWFEHQGLLCQVVHHDIIDSTNSWAIRNIGGLVSPCLVLADEQSAGRGRFARSFASPRRGLYMSLAHRDLPAMAGNLPGIAMAVAARRVLATRGIDLGIKWVNDLYARGRKVGGILAESSLNAKGEIEWVVVGLGLNLEAGVLPDDLMDRAGGLWTPGEGEARDPDRSPPVLAREIARTWLTLVGHLPHQDFVDEYREASVLNGRQVTVSWPGLSGRTPCVVTVLEILAGGELRVRHTDGTLEDLTAGECSLGSGALD